LTAERGISVSPSIPLKPLAIVVGNFFYPSWRFTFTIPFQLSTFATLDRVSCSSN
jgi:hypothetical protein